eukprot:366347-Chlamydomonas_euryale.AAC.3
MCDATWAGGGAQRGGELDAESVPQTVQAPQDHGPDSNPKDADIKDSDCSSAAAVANEANTTLLATGEVLTQVGHAEEARRMGADTAWRLAAGASARSTRCCGGGLRSSGWVRS